jgi:hypothetical protein
VLKALPAQHRPSLRRPERYRSFFPALRTVRPGLGLRVRMPARRPVRRSPNHCHSFALAILAAFGFILELLVVEEKLFTRCEHEVRATIYALQNLVLVFHWRGAPIPRPCSARETRIGKDPVHIVGRRFTSPSCCPLDSARHAVCTAWILSCQLMSSAGKIYNDFHFEPCSFSNPSSFRFISAAIWLRDDPALG